MALGPGSSALTPTMVDPPRVPARAATVQRQFAARAARFAAHDAIVREIERRLVERLDAIRLVPQRIVDVGCGAGHSQALLRERYARAEWLGIDATPAMLALGRHTASRWAARMTHWWTARSGHAHPHRAVAWADRLPLADAGVDLVFSNLMLHWHPQPHTLFPEWQRVLRPDGLLLFSSFGPDTLVELRAACAEALPQAMPMPFVDMHDFGDMMVAAGFANPVMDVERLTLTFESPQALLREVRALGANPRDDRPAGLPGSGTAHRLLQALEARRGADGRIALTFEVAFGHAWRPQRGPGRGDGPVETRVALDSVRAALRSRGGASR